MRFKEEDITYEKLRKHLGYIHKNIFYEFKSFDQNYKSLKKMLVIEAL